MCPVFDIVIGMGVMTHTLTPTREGFLGRSEVSLGEVRQPLSCWSDMLQVLIHVILTAGHQGPWVTN